MLTVDNIITPDRFISLAHNCISERRHTGIELVPERNIFFVKTDHILEFYNRFVPHIRYDFKLITHDSDNPIIENYKPLLENQYLKKWYGMNCHIIHDKLQPIPIGIASECWPHGDKQALLDVVNSTNVKVNSIYSNFNKGTNLTQRQNVNEILKKLPGLDIEKEKLCYKDYLTKLASYKFAISPPGNSVDCHRIWECILLGVIPIVLKSVPMVYFKDCPILFIDKWEDLFSIDLESKYITLIQKPKDKANFTFYKNLILA